MLCWLFVAESNEILVPGVLFEEFVLDIADDVQEYTTIYENNAAADRLYSNGELNLSLGDRKQDGEKFSAAELEEAAAACAKQDKHFNLFKEVTSTNSCQVQNQLWIST